MYASSTIAFTNPFHHHNENLLLDQQFASYAAYANLNRPPTPPPEMHGALYSNDYTNSRQEHGYGSVSRHNHKAQDQKRASSPARPSFEVADARQQDNVIAPSFQIPKAVNLSGGSLSELAAEVRCQNISLDCKTDCYRSHAFSGLSRPS